MKTSKKEVSKRINALMKERGMNQKDLFDKTGIGQQRLSIIQNGESYPTIEQIVDIAQALNTTTDYLLTGQHYENPDLTIIKALIKKLNEAGKNI